MKKLLVAAVIASSTFAATASAGQMGEGSYFDRVEARYFEVESGYDADVFGISARKSFANDFYFTADYYRHDHDIAGHLNQVFAGVGYKHNFTNKFTGFADVNAAQANGSNDYSESGYSVQLGGVYRQSNNLEFSALVRHADVELDSQEFELGARYYANQNWSLSVNYMDGFESDTLSAWFVSAAYHW